MQLVRKLNAESHQNLLEYLDNYLRPLLKPDVSNYAQKRQRLWLFHEANLGKEPAIKNGHWDEKLWRLSQKIYPECDIALISRHGDDSDARIKYHRDATYALPPAIILNIGGKAIFSWNKNRSSQKDEEATKYLLEPGNIYAFDCKHRHALLEAEEGRWGLILWQIRKGDKRYPLLKRTNQRTIQ